MVAVFCHNRLLISLYIYIYIYVWVLQLGQLRQLPGVGDTMCVRLAGGHIVTLVDLARASSAKVDSIAGRKHPFGHGK